MATTLYIPVEECLQSSYEADRDYIDGELHERHYGEGPHGILQVGLAYVLTKHLRATDLVPLISVRIQTSPTRILVPDVCVIAEMGDGSDIVRVPPVLCVEVLSCTDQFQRMLTKLEEYLRFGVPNLWLIDPMQRRVWNVSTDLSLTGENTELTLAGTSVRIPVTKIFSELA